MGQNVRWVIVRWGWRGWWKRPVWYCHVKHPVIVREWGVGPISIQRRVGW